MNGSSLGRPESSYNCCRMSRTSCDVCGGLCCLTMNMTPNGRMETLVAIPVMMMANSSVEGVWMHSDESGWLLLNLCALGQSIYFWTNDR